MIPGGLYCIIDHAILYGEAKLKVVNTTTNLNRGETVLYLNENVGTMSRVVTKDGIVGYVDYRFLSSIL